MTKIYTKTSESVSAGHPDKVADQISDAIYDLLRTKKQFPQSAVETAAGANKLLIFGEIDREIVFAASSANSANGNAASFKDLQKSEFASNRVEEINHELTAEIKETALKTIRKIGYSENDYSPEIIVDLVSQSEEINNAVEANSSHKETGAGDQGITFGFATNETRSGHELHFILAHRILEAFEKLRETEKDYDFLKPDAKAQVTVEYRYADEGTDTPLAIKHILVSSQTAKGEIQEFRDKIKRVTLQTTTDFINRNFEGEVKANLIASLRDTEILINPAGLWTFGGPAADSGLTGRKLVVDNYGSAAPIGGGATSGKNTSKVDRSGAYFARFVAKSLVKSRLADKVLVELGWAIGIPKPTAINIETFGTERVSLETLNSIVENNFDFSVDNLISFCEIDKFSKTSQHGNYTSEEFPWENALILEF